MFAFMSDVTRILSAIEQGDPSAAEQLLPLVYEELRKLAAQRLAQEKPGQTLQATALVHEAYLRLVDVDRAQHWNSRGHFFAAAAEAMRRILIEIARRKGDPRPAGDTSAWNCPTCRPSFNGPTWTCSQSVKRSTSCMRRIPGRRNWSSCGSLPD
jgi:RNA polymerase sigma factor (TIGR02999 family)